MKDTLKAKTLVEMRDPHIDSVMEELFERDERAIQYAIEKLANWILDKEGPSISREEFAEEIASLIEHRSACVLDSAVPEEFEGEEHA